MKRLLLSALTVLTSLTATPVQAQEGEIFYQPLAADVNRYRYELNAYERNGGFAFNDGQMGKCQDPFKNVKIEGTVVVVIVDRCLADKLMAKRYLVVEEAPRYSRSLAVQEFMQPLQKMWDNIVAPNYGYHELKLRATSGGVLGSVFNGNLSLGPKPGKQYVSPLD